MRDREGMNRTRETGHLDEIQGVVAIGSSYRGGVVHFIDWLDAALNYGRGGGVG